MTALPTIRLTDTLQQKKLDFHPQEPGVVRIYCCGPTVYGYTHIGNARAALTLDLIERIFTSAGYEVLSARNFTDIDDKIISTAKAENRSTEEVAQFYERTYVEELKLLNCLPCEFTPRATESIQEIIQFIEGLIGQNFAYTASGTSSGSDVYFRVQNFKSYGRLSKRKLKDMFAGARIEPDEAKEHPGDFALWKAAKEGEPFWQSPWGKGRPGWHIECSAMIRKCFDTKLDIHMGGIDLIFPHHENEIAQSESLQDKPLASYWLHNGMIEVGKEKMSKSLGNIFKTGDFISRYGAETLRLLVLQQHYRSPMDSSQEGILRTESLIEKLYHAKGEVMKAVAEKVSTSLSAVSHPPELVNLKGRIEECLFDDFNTAKALGLILSALRVCNRESSSSFWAAWQPCIETLRSVYGILDQDPASALQEMKKRKRMRANLSTEKVEEIERALKMREAFRKDKKFAEGDEIRRSLEATGILIMDGPDGSDWSVG